MSKLSCLSLFYLKKKKKKLAQNLFSFLASGVVYLSYIRKPIMLFLLQAINVIYLCVLIVFS